MAELSCEQCRELAAELALDALAGRERAQTLAHLENCPACQDTVSALTATVERLVQLLPRVQPPAGFEQRVITALTAPSRRPRRWWVPSAAVLLTVALATGGWFLGHSHHDLPLPETDATANVRTVMFAPLTTGNRQIGQAYVYPGQPSWIYLSLDTGSDTPNGIVRGELVRRDGSTVPVATFPLTKGRAAWGGPAAINRDTLITARLINTDGRTLAAAHFAPPPDRPAHRPTFDIDDPYRGHDAPADRNSRGTANTHRRPAATPPSKTATTPTMGSHHTDWRPWPGRG